MIAARLGCQLCILFCGLQAASLQHGAEVAQGWPAIIVGDVMVSVMRLVHMPIGFQVSSLPELTLILTSRISA